MKWVNRTLIGTGCALLAGCAMTPTQESGSGGAAVVGGGTHNAGLIFIEPINAGTLLAKDRPPGIKDAREGTVIQTCTQQAVPAQVVVGLAILGEVVGELIKLGADKIDSELQDALKKYTATYSASQWIAADSSHSLYSSVNPLTLRYSCFRFSRGEKTAHGDVVHLDLVGQIELAPGGDALIIRPLRLYIDKLDATSSNPDYSVAFSIKADAFWRTKNAGQESVTFDKPLLTTKVLKNSSPTLQYFLDDDSKVVRVPIIPYSDPLPGTITQGGSAMITVSVVENGVPSRWLQELSKLFSGSKSSLEKSLTSTIDSRLGLPTPSSSSGSSSTSSSTTSSNWRWKLESDGRGTTDAIDRQHKTMVRRSLQ